MGGSRCRNSLIVSAIFVVVAAGCGGSSDADEEPAASASGPTEPSGDDPDFVRTTGSAGDATDLVTESVEPADSTTSIVAVEAGETPEIAVVPETGVPGIDSEDGFCRSWSRFAGSFQALGLASAFGEPLDAIRLEVIASPAVVTAVEQLAVHLPAELEAERPNLLEDFVGPFSRRAAKARSALVEAGAQNLEGLGAAWLTQLAETGVDDPFIAVVIPGGVGETEVGVAAAAFADAVPGIVQDPSLVTDASIPLTEQFLVANCPDGGVLAGNDVVS